MQPQPLLPWEHITTLFCDRSMAGCWGFKITLRLYPKTRVDYDPLDGTLHHKQRNT